MVKKLLFCIITTSSIEKHIGAVIYYVHNVNGGMADESDHWCRENCL